MLSTQVYYHKYLHWVSPVILVCCFALSACTKYNDINADGQSGPPLPTFQEVLKVNKSYSVFDAVLRKTGLLQRLSLDSQYTILVPDNDALLNAGIRADSLLGLESRLLENWAAYHILRGNYSTERVPQTLDNIYYTYNGLPIWFSKPLLATALKYSSDDPQIVIDRVKKTLHVNGATATAVDLKVVNGVMHGMDAPLKLPANSVKSFLDGNSRFSLFVAALKKFNLYDKLDSPGPFTVFAPDNDAMIRRGFDMELIKQDTFNSRYYEVFLLSCYMISSRTFTSHFTDGQIAGQLEPSYIQYNAYGKVILDRNKFPIPAFQASQWPSDDFSYGRPLGLQSSYESANINYKDQPAYNGVIHGVDELFVFPDSVHIHH
jgi:uncharacterized surface protein with fasciclin (FAS1) repeats